MPLLVIFAGLFILVAGLEKAVITPDIIAWVGNWRLDHVGVLTSLTAVLSNIVSNVPAVLVLEPIVAHLADPERALLVIAIASTLAGPLSHRLRAAPTVVKPAVKSFLLTQRTVVKSNGCAGAQ
ncbi:SLC13 family permease [Rhizobium sp. NXC24]|uniref:SLC13 family permease n=1 Tax=Rhizobium sp. NXC24 TaxID=2048897 RepID=UPI00267A0969